MEKRKKEDGVRQKKREERAPTLAELSLSEEELRRLGEIGVRLQKKLKVGKAGITEGIVNTIHEQWRRSEVVKIVCEDLCRLNMKRTHDLLEVWFLIIIIYLFSTPSVLLACFRFRVCQSNMGSIISLVLSF